MFSTYNLLNFIIFREIKKIIKKNEQIKILDVGSSNISRFQKFDYKNKKIVSFDINIEKKYNFKNQKLVLGNAKNINKYFKPNSFDVVCAIDLIEHLKKKEANKLIKNLKQISKTKLIIFTPNGFLPQKPTKINPYMKHLSGYTHEELEKQGFKTSGLLGLKIFRGEHHKLRSILLYPLSLLSIVFTFKILKKLDAACFAVFEKKL